MTIPRNNDYSEEMLVGQPEIKLFEELGRERCTASVRPDPKLVQYRSEIRGIYAQDLDIAVAYESV